MREAPLRDRLRKLGLLTRGDAVAPCRGGYAVASGTVADAMASVASMSVLGTFAGTEAWAAIFTTALSFGECQFGTTNLNEIEFAPYSRANPNFIEVVFPNN